MQSRDPHITYWKAVIAAVPSVLVALIALAAAPGLVSAQTLTQPVGDCEPGNAEAFLDIGDVRAKILNQGGLFWNGGPNVYEIPKGSGNHSNFLSGFQIAGIVDDTLRMAGSTYGPFEFWPGPIPEDGSAPTDCKRFDRIYEVQVSGGDYPGPVPELTGDIADWPAHLGAPFIDAGDSPESYDPDEGDYPAMLGDQMLWWIMNDRGNEHKRTKTKPLGIEVRALAFAFDAAGPLGRTTYYRYRIRNRGTDAIRAAYIGLFNDVDLGGAFDDYVGSDTTTGTAYFYNADDDDGNYGKAPPAIGFTVLTRPQSTIDTGSEECSYPDEKEVGLTSNVSYNGGGGVTGDPNDADDFYNYYRARWRDGQPITIGGNGRDHLAEPIHFMFPGDPVEGAFWSEFNSNDDGWARQPSDRRSLSAVGPFCLGPGDETEVVFAIVWARGESNLDSVTDMRVLAAGVQSITDSLLEPRRLEPAPPEPVPATPFTAGLYPNPAAEATTVHLGLPRAMDVRIDVFDMLGRRMAAVVDARLEAGSHMWRLDVTDWPPGAYLVRMQVDHITETRRLVVAH